MPATGLSPKEVAGLSPDKQPAALDPLCLIRSVAAEYPLTVLLPGDQNTDVPYQQSVGMADALARAPVEHQLIIIWGVGHGFDLARVQPDVAEAFREVVGFLRHYLGSPVDPGN